MEENDDLEEIQSSHLLKADKRNDTDIPFCGCLSIQYYRPYFDVDTVDVKDRLLNSIFFCYRERNFMTLMSEKPDLYGPFWVWRLVLTDSYFYKNVSF